MNRRELIGAMFGVAVVPCLPEKPKIAMPQSLGKPLFCRVFEKGTLPEGLGFNWQTVVYEKSARSGGWWMEKSALDAGVKPPTAEQMWT